MKLKLGLAVIGCLALSGSIIYSSVIVYQATKMRLLAWESGRCWDKLGESLEGKEFQLDYKKGTIKNFETLTYEDMIRALYVLQTKLDQNEITLRSIREMATSEPDIE